MVKLERTSKGAVHAGSKVEFTAHVSTALDAVHSVRLSIGATHATIDPKCVLSSGLCELGDLTKAAAKDVDFTLTVSSKLTSGTVAVSTEALSSPDNADASAVPYKLTVTKAPKPKPTHSSGGSGSSGSSGSSGAGGTSGSGSAHLPVGGTGALGGGAVPTPSNSALLPSVAPQQTQAPVTAPGTTVSSGDSQRMRGTAAEADEMTFDKLASTQAAWLAALLVAFALLMTQVRLGRVHVRDPKQKGAHRRPRRTGGAH